MVRYATSNEGKAREASAYLGDTIEAVNVEYPEIQAESFEPIAATGAESAFAALTGDRPVIVDDAGLSIEALDGFPGPYSSFVEETLGIDRIANIALAEETQSATFHCVIAYTDGTQTETFHGQVRGRIVPARGDGGFGYDPIFEYGDRTFAEMEPAEKNAISHRGRALEQFADWYADQARGSRSVPE